MVLSCHLQPRNMRCLSFKIDVAMLPIIGLKHVHGRWYKPVKVGKRSRSPLRFSNHDAARPSKHELVA